MRGTDPDPERIRKLQQALLPVYEPGLPELVAEQAKLGRLTFVTAAREAFQDADFIFLTFDTPVDESDHSDLSPVEAYLEPIVRHARPDATIVVMSQVPAGTCDCFAERLHRLAPYASFSVLSHPENLRLGQALAAYLQPDFILVGAADENAARGLLRLYEGIPARKLVVGRSSAEMAKHSLNAFLATSISFVNELAGLAEVCGADIREVVRVLRLDRRIGEHAFLSPGPGFSGGTLGRDLQVLRGLGAGGKQKTLQLDATIAVNDSRLNSLLEKLKREYSSLSGLHVGLLGLTYKAGTSTLRRSRALELATMLLSSGASIRAFDPHVCEPQPETRGIALCEDAYQAAEGADALFLLTPWPAFQDLDLNRLRQGMRRPLMIDAHNYLDAGAARAAGLRYRGVGIPEPLEAPTGVGIGGRT